MADFDHNQRGGLTVNRGSLHASAEYKQQVAALDQLFKESEMAEKMTLDQAMYAVADKCANDETAWAAWLQVHAHLAQPAQAVDVPYDNALNDAGWAFTKAMPVPLSGPVFNNVKPALKAAIEKWMQMRAIGNAQADGWTRVGTLTLQRWKGIDSMLNADFDYAGDLPDGDYQVFVQTPPQPEE